MRISDANQEARRLLILQRNRLQDYCLGQAKSRLTSAKPEVLKRLFQVINALSRHQKNLPFHQLDIKGLAGARDMAQTDQDFAVELRFVIEQELNCALAYRTHDGFLIITTPEALEEGIRLGNFSYQKSTTIKARLAQAVPVVSPPVAPVIEQVSPDKAIILHPKEQGLVERDFTDRYTALQDIVSTMARGDYETAALLTFFQRTPAEAWDIIQAASKVECVLDKDTQAEVRLDIEMEALEGRSTNLALIIAARLLESYPPNESSRYLAAWEYLQFLTLDDVVDVLIYMSLKGSKQCVPILLYLIGGGKGKLVDQVFAQAYQRPLCWEEHFVVILQGLYEENRADIYAPEQYNGTTIFRRNLVLARVRSWLASSPSAVTQGNVVPSSSTAIEPYEESIFRNLRMLKAISPEEHLKQHVRQLLAKGESRLAAEIAFGRGAVYAVMVPRMQHDFSPEESGQMLLAMEKNVLFRRLVEFHQAKPDFETEVQALDAFLSALALLGGERNVPALVQLLDEMILADPDTKWAAYWLLEKGVSYFTTRGDMTDAELDAIEDHVREPFIEAFWGLEERHAKEGWRDLSGFVRYGTMLPAEVRPDKEADRKVVLKKCWAIVNSSDATEREKVEAVRTIGRLGGTRYFNGLLAKARRRSISSTFNAIAGRGYWEHREHRECREVMNAIVVALAELYGELPKGKRKMNFEKVHLRDRNAPDDWFRGLLFDNCEKEMRLAGSRIIPMLSEILQHKTLTPREGGEVSQAAKILGEIGNPAAVIALEKALESESGTAREAAANKLGEIAEKVPLPFSLLEKALKQRYPNPIVKILGDMGDERAIPLLREALGHGHTATIIEALGKFGPAAIPILEPKLEDFFSTAVLAANKLGEIGHESAIPALQKALRRKNPALRRAAANALLKIKQYDDFGRKQMLAYVYIVDEKWEQLADLGRAALPALEAALDGYYPETAIATAKVCGELKAVRTIPALGEQLDQIGLTSSESHEREGALKVINAVAEALGMIGDEDALPFLEGALKHWKSEVKIAAAKALGEMGPAAIPILEGALEQEKPWNSWVRGAITEALERIQSRQPLPQTEVPLLEADNLSVGAIAAHVLRETEEKVPVPVARKAKEKE